MPLPDLVKDGILPEGVHEASEKDLEDMFVAPFPASKTRDRNLKGFVAYRDVFAQFGVPLTQWVDGSFVDATRESPDDIDVVNFAHAGDLNTLDPAVRAVVAPLLQGKIERYHTHAHLEVHFPKGHKFAAKFENMRRYWRDWFSRCQDYSGPVKKHAPWRGSKGFVQMTTSDGNVSPVIDMQ